MFERDHADALIQTLQDMLAQLQKVAEDELQLMQKVNPSGAPTPISADAVAILGARMQIMTLITAVSTIGRTVVEILQDRAEERDLGLG